MFHCDESTRDDQPVILVIDDDPAIVQLLIRWLHAEGFRVTWAEDGLTGLSIAEKYRPDAVILDLGLPGTDGLTICREIKARLSTGDTPVLIITGKMRDDALITQVFDAGAQDVMFKPLRKGEVLARLRAALRERELREAYHQLAIRDSLTGLANRRQFFIELTAAVMTAKRDRRDSFLLLSDIDQVAAINERWGHEFGDEVILTFSRIVKRLISPLCRAGRIGGEEFALVLYDHTPERALMLAERLRTTFASIAFDADSEPKHFFAGFGVAKFDGSNDSFTADQFMTQADVALFVAKETGRGRVAAYWQLDPESLPIVAPHKRHSKSRERKRTQRSFVSMPIEGSLPTSADGPVP